MKNKMNKIPTPETDAALCRYEHPDWPSGRKHTVNGKPVVLADFARDLERRLTVARDAMQVTFTASFQGHAGRAHNIIDAALTQTAPKP